MSAKISDFKRVIREANYENTYKMAWAKSLVEIASLHTIFPGENIIDFRDISKCFFKYYWNQTIFFNLIQGSNIKKQPRVLQIVKRAINDYFDFMGSKMPVMFERVESTVFESDLNKIYSNSIQLITTVLKADVSWRFLKLDGKILDIYKYEKGNDYIRIDGLFLEELKANQTDLFELINYRWGLILETFNSSPRINKKVKIIDERDIKRNSLSKFKKYLDLENPNHICSICGEVIPDNELSIDHVIPWSYLFSDDLWNLIYVHKSCNSCKSNRIPTETEIIKLKERNQDLLKKARELNIKDKEIDKLEIANKYHYVGKFWMGCK